MAPTPTHKQFVAFQGIHGAHSDMACHHAHPYYDTLPCASFDDVFDAVASGKAELGMVPIENSQAGRVAEMHLLLPQSDLHFVGEYFHRVEHHLLAPKDASPETISTVYSHPQALMQCRESLQKLGIKEHRAHSDTAASARDVAKWNDPTIAAIGSRLAAELYGLQIIAENIEDSHDNVTHFITLSREPLEPDPAKQQVLTSLLFTVRNIPSALFKALGGFATNNVNLVKLESYIVMPARGKAQFFITFEGHPQDRNVQLALEELGFFCTQINVLGVYYADPFRYSD